MQIFTPQKRPLPRIRDDCSWTSTSDSPPLLALGPPSAEEPKPETNKLELVPQSTPVAKPPARSVVEMAGEMQKLLCGSSTKEDKLGGGPAKKPKKTGAKKKADAGEGSAETSLVLGCSKCRYSDRGCGVCRDPKFRGKRGHA